jgi:hypothetical protein
MTVDLYVLIAAVILVLTAGVASLVAYVQSRTPRAVVCPLDGRPAAMRVDAAHAALAIVTGSPRRVAGCSFWPGRGRCGQICVEQVRPMPETARLLRLLRRWYAGQRCTLCGGEFGELRWCDFPPTLLGSGGQSRPWFEMTAADAAAGIAAGDYRPLCWRCHVLEGLRRNPRPRPVRPSQRGASAPPV